MGAHNGPRSLVGGRGRRSVTVLRSESEAGGRVGVCPGLYDDPIVGVPPTTPTPLPASLPRALPTRPVTKLPAGARVHPRPVGPTVTVPAPPDRVRRRRGSLTSEAPARR
jgi:hypothetical protein